MMRLATAAVVLAGSIACTANVSLGTRAAPLVIGTTAPVSCVGGRPVARFATGALGELRALSASGGALYAAFARSDGQGVVARVDGSDFVEVARVGGEPSALAIDVGADETVAFVASSATSDVRRIARAGIGVVPNQSNVGAIVVAAHVAYWSRPDADAVVTADFAGGGASVVLTTPRPAGLVIADQSLFISSDRNTVSVADVLGSRPIASACGAHGFGVTTDDIYCGSNRTLYRVSRVLGTDEAVQAFDDEVGDVVVARGRAFWREGSVVWSVPLDRVGGPLVFATATGPAILATDGCDLYFATTDAVVRRPL